MEAQSLGKEDKVAVLNEEKIHILYMIMRIGSRVKSILRTTARSSWRLSSAESAAIEGGMASIALMLTFVCDNSISSHEFADTLQPSPACLHGCAVAIDGPRLLLFDLVQDIILPVDVRVDFFLCLIRHVQ